MTEKSLTLLVNEISSNYEAEEIFVTKPSGHFPNRDAIISIIKDVRSLMFPGYFAGEVLEGVGAANYVAEQLLRIRNALRTQVREALLFRDGSSMSMQAISTRTDEICATFMAELPNIQELLFKDVQAAFDGDPAAQSKQEIILAYPGLFAIFVYRIAHVLYTEKVPLIPRLMTEYAHGKTGVDINAGAVIGEYFFIDHATGVVIGETTTIGSHVKIYQGVTLGALSTRKGQLLSGVKRHPTIEDDVTIYSNASVLGGETVVGKGAIIAGSAFVTESVPPYARVSLKNQEVVVRTRSDAKPAPDSDAPTWEI